MQNKCATRTTGAKRIFLCWQCKVNFADVMGVRLCSYNAH